VKWYGISTGLPGKSPGQPGGDHVATALSLGAEDVSGVPVDRLGPFAPRADLLGAAVDGSFITHHGVVGEARKQRIGVVFRDGTEVGVDRSGSEDGHRYPSLVCP